MPDYAKYRAALGITNNDIIGALKLEFPSFSKIQCSMINNPKRYGVQLTKEAETVLASQLGFADGLSIKRRKKPQVKRVKTNRLTVRLDDASYDRVKSKMQQRGSESVQSFLEELIRKETEEQL